jgi:hypothetical protein
VIPSSPSLYLPEAAVGGILSTVAIVWLWQYLTSIRLLLSYIVRLNLAGNVTTQSCRLGHSGAALAQEHGPGSSKRADVLLIWHAFHNLEGAAAASGEAFSHGRIKACSISRHAQHKSGNCEVTSSICPWSNQNMQGPVPRADGMAPECHQRSC